MFLLPDYRLGNIPSLLNNIKVTMVTNNNKQKVVETKHSLPIISLSQDLQPQQTPDTSSQHFSTRTRRAVGAASLCCLPGTRQQPATQIFPRKQINLLLSPSEFRWARTDGSETTGVCYGADTT